ncbi:MAG: tetratricopeptide repeat protein [Bradyrhizobium sp.]|uniref:tetratricopeptide repeat protein n=1 Tax=Bradyrhizobium sp. TaxID=376 RepID=UPI003C7BEDC0
MGTTDLSSRGRVYSVRPLLAIFAFGGLLFIITGCNTTCSTPDCAPVAVPVVADGPPTTGKVQDPDDVKYYRSDEPLRMGIEHFNRGNFGIAERYFRDATEKAPKDPTAWIGLAASYDRVARFDLADRAYAYAIRLVGETTEILNNQGYSYMLRGDLVNARKKFLKAYEREPGNPTIANNLQLLNSSSRFIQRAPAQ